MTYQYGQFPMPGAQPSTHPASPYSAPTTAPAAPAPVASPAPAAGSLLGISAETRVSAKVPRLPPGFQGVVEITGSEVVMNAQVGEGRTDDRFFGHFRVIEIHQQGEAAVLPGAELGFGESIKTEMGKGAILSFLCAAVGIDAARDDNGRRAVASDAAFQNAACARGSTALAGRRVLVHTRRHVSKRNGHEKTVHNFFPLAPAAPAPQAA